MEMESRWYLSPGQDLENTKIEDRGHALHATRNAWNKITAHLDRNRLIQEAIEKEQAQRRAIKEGSEEMTKTWDNSVENIRKRKEEERQARLAKSKEDKMQQFMEMRKEQAAVRAKFIDDARKEIYISRGYPKALTSALIQAEVMHERQKQVQLERAIEEHAKEEAAKFAKRVKEAAEMEIQENLEKEKKALQKKLELRKEYLEEITAKEESNKKLKEKKIEKEKQDNINAEKEYKRIKEMEHEQDRQKKAQVKKEFQEFYKKQAKARELLKLEEKETDLVIDIYGKAKHRIQCLRVKKEKELQKALQVRQEAAARQVIQNAKAKTEEEEQILKKAQEEKEQEENERRNEKERIRKQLIQDRIDNRKAFLEAEKQREFEDNERRKWEMLNRYKQCEAMQKYEEEKLQKSWKDTLQYREELFKQMDENEEVKQKEKMEALAMFESEKQKLAAEDQQFLNYAEECLEYAKKRGRSTDPVERVILQYKKENRLPVNIIKQCRDDFKRSTKKTNHKAVE